MPDEKRINTIVLDAGGIIKNDPPVSTLLASSENLVTTPSVLSEIRDSNTRSRVETTLRPFLQVKPPRPESIRFVKDFARKTGDLAVLSGPDVELLALAYDLECERNGGDWRLRRTPGQKRTNGPPPEKQSREEHGEQVQEDGEAKGSGNMDIIPSAAITEPQDSVETSVTDAEPTEATITVSETGHISDVNTQEPIFGQGSNLNTEAMVTALGDMQVSDANKTESAAEESQQSDPEATSTTLGGIQIPDANTTESINERSSNFDSDAMTTTLEGIQVSDANTREYINEQSSNSNMEPNNTIDNVQVPDTDASDFVKEQSPNSNSERIASNLENIQISSQNTKSSPIDQGSDATAPETSDSDPDSEGWITPSNIKKHQARDLTNGPTSPSSKAEPQTIQVATLTTDFAMQNVLLQMNLNLLSPSLQRVRHLRTYILRCHACFGTTKEMSKQFCPRCGKPTLTRVSCSTNANGEFKMHLKKNMQWNTRGDRYSIPKPVSGSASGRAGASKGGGKGGWGQELILAEDQKEYVRAMTKQKRQNERDLMDEDFLPAILTGERGRAGGRPKIGAGRNVNSRKR